MQQSDCRKSSTLGPKLLFGVRFSPLSDFFIRGSLKKDVKVDATLKQITELNKDGKDQQECGEDQASQDNHNGRVNDNLAVEEDNVNDDRRDEKLVDQCPHLTFVVDARYKPGLARLQASAYCHLLTSWNSQSKTDWSRERRCRSFTSAVPQNTASAIKPIVE